MDEATGSAGEARNQLSKTAVTDMAMRQCRTGGPHCKVIIAYCSQCVAIAQVQGRKGFLIAAVRAEQSNADQYVRSECSSHGAREIVYRACSGAIRMQRSMLLSASPCCWPAWMTNYGFGISFTFLDGG
ncbi:DUF4189 domain-containing protein [Rhizobium sp. P28RR-XV]|uniref:DUF4189 domain-containing protein n=1 Tax=Rhizobium sp. P28RR-XV TaxID=2726737 RepID=UPI0014573DA3|nr:DUF4189 domain-containing protein [Rhizobium sp. P28RR-XV]